MPKRIRLRTLTKEEEESVRRLANSRRAAARLVQRAKLIEQLIEDETKAASVAAPEVGLSGAMGVTWVKRFNDSGLAGLEDKPRSGRPASHDEEVRSQVLNLALQKPRSLGYPFQLWTLSRLETALAEKHKLKLVRSTIWQILKAEGLHWKRQQSWFHDAEKHDPEFVEKRGSLSNAT